MSVCDLPRTGAAALSGVLEVGKELLTLNNHSMSWLTFDKIIDLSLMLMLKMWIFCFVGRKRIVMQWEIFASEKRE